MHSNYCSICKGSHKKLLLGLYGQTKLFFKDICAGFHFLIFTLSNARLILKLQLLVIMLHPNSPEHNYKHNAEQRIDNSGKLFQTPDLVFVGLLPDFILVKFLECLFLFLLIDINKLSTPKIQFYVLVDYVMRKHCKRHTRPKSFVVSPN